MAAMEQDAQELGGPGGAVAADLIQTLDKLRQQMVERERWIANLLRQRQKRQVSLFGRKLEQHELDFIARVDGNES